MSSLESPGPATRNPCPWVSALVLLALCGLVLFLRWPTFGVDIWNVDEAIHAGAARTLLDGGVMYRDAVDQRTPLTYYAVAGLFALTGENNLWAVRAFIAILIAATAFGVYLLGRHWRGAAAGLWASAVFVALSSTMLYPGDANAANTEWFVEFFVVWGAWLLWRRGPVPDFPRALLVGIVYSLAFLSKQPALLEVGAPLGLLIGLGLSRRAAWTPIGRAVLGICTGYILTVAAVFGYFWLRGALGDFYFYAWTYNLVFYGPEVNFAARLAAAGALPGLLGSTYPLVLAVATIALAAGAVRLLQLRPTAEESAERPSHLFLGGWLVLAAAGAASAGRVYGHYFIQVLVPLSLLTGLALADLTARARVGLAGLGARMVAAAVAATLAWHPLAHGRRNAWHPDPAQPIAAAVKAHTHPDERIFVWGWNPDIYLYADRKPASRFLYCSFLTGLVPWTNVAADRDTDYAIVPGTLETLVSEIETRRPVMIVDCSVGPHRQFQKYPLEKFPRLQDVIDRHYVEFERRASVLRGFRIFLLKDESRSTPLPLEAGPPTRLEVPTLFAPQTAAPVPTDVEIAGRDPAGRLQRLDLLVDGQRIDGASFKPSQAVALTVRVPFHLLGMGRRVLQVRATAADGTTRDSDPQTVECGAPSLPQEELRGFALPHLAATVVPQAVRAVYGAKAREEAGRRVYFAHAPSTLVYAVPAQARALRGVFFIRPEAYDPTIPGPTDGAEFIVDWVDPSGARTTLFRRLLTPQHVTADRGDQTFEVRLPRRAGRIELIATPGPTGSAASDWTCWADLLLIDVL